MFGSCVLGKLGESQESHSQFEAPAPVKAPKREKKTAGIHFDRSKQEDAASLGAVINQNPRIISPQLVEYYIGDENLPMYIMYVGILISHYKDSY